jgi:hypothetical protein
MDLGSFSNVLTPQSYLTEESLEMLLVQIYDSFRHSPFVGGRMTPVSITMSGSKERVLKFLREKHQSLEQPGAELVGNLIDHIEETPDNAEGFSISLYASVQYSLAAPAIEPCKPREVGP